MIGANKKGFEGRRLDHAAINNSFYNTYKNYNNESINLL